MKMPDDIEAAKSALASTDTTKFFDLLGIKTEAGRHFVWIALANAALFDRKQQDYGPRNISGFGTFGVIVRMNDKHERLKTLFGKGKSRKRARNESVLDSLRDISNYAIIATMLERGEWPNE